MTRRNRQDLAPSLFPFLAVLVCTLGTLILLLALVAHNTATAAEQRARAELSQQTTVAQPDADQLTQSQAAAMIDEAGFRIDAVESIRQQQAAAVEERREQLTHLEDHIDRLQKDLRRLSDEMQLASADRQVTAVDDAELASIREQIATEQRAIERLRRETGNETPRVVIVPHKGPNGTTRRPIYVECTSAGLTIWPEGVKITTEQLVDRRSRLANPLDAALRVARLHIMRTYGDIDPPYPLLIVRPHGTDAYFQATAAMDDWDDQYGYEMLDSDIELAFNSPDPNLKRRMEQAIQQALARQTDRRTPRAVPLSASQLARDGGSRGFSEVPDHGYGGQGAGGTTDFAQQTNRLNEIYRQAAQELRARDDQDPTLDAEVQSGNQAGNRDQSRGIADAADPDQPQRQSTASNASTTSGDLRGDSQNGSGASSPPASPQQSSSENRVSGDQANPSASVMVQRDGDNWALPSSVTRATGITIVRSIRVQFYQDRFEVPASRSERRQVIPINGNIDAASLQLATLLRDRIERWGVALDNGRWEPRLEVEVMDGDVAKFHQLKQLLDGSGIEVTNGSAR